MTMFRAVFLAVVIGTLLLVAAFLIQSGRPAVEVDQPTPELVRAAGKCASCHRDETAAVVAEYERSEHAREGVNCLDCHRPVGSQVGEEHRGFTITMNVTALNCDQCHATQYRQFLRSRHAAPAFAAVRGSEPFTEEQIEHAETYHPGAVDRPANALAQLEGAAAIESGCEACHSIGRPNPDGSIGSCTACHSRHSASVELARTPRTCGQCHMGPDHSQIEIYEESKHGVIYEAQHDGFNMSAEPTALTVEDMPVPTCSTCHMSGIEGLSPTHDVTERLSWWLFSAVSERRPTYLQGQEEMKAVCMNCHTETHTDEFYEQAERVVLATNDKVGGAEAIMDSLRAEGLLTPEPFDEPAEFLYFDLWHYYGRTAKHGAFMGGADFVQWHGNYELLLKTVELKEIAAELRAHGSPKAYPTRYDGSPDD
ncbi:MAG: multiheme c-type cytochrome [Longimicrobiales bacterium]|nr:multiheme c-type cytochrome [Longimicrobiales bacterium]